MMNEMLWKMLQEEHRRDLMAEADRERLARQAGGLGLQCQLCLRLGRWLVALGQRMVASGSGELVVRLGA